MVNCFDWSGLTVYPICTLYTAVSRKVVLKTEKSLRDNKVIMGNGSCYGCLSEPQGVQRG